MSFESVEEIIDYAIGKEEEAVAFYTDLSTNETFSGNRDTFGDFANEEKKHVSMLKNFKGNRETIAQYKYEWIPDMKRSDYMVDIEYENGMSYPDMLRLAMKREEKSLQLYNELAGKVEDDDFIKMFKVLCQEEAKHKRILETIYDEFMAAQGD
jgi:rubrerythrin